MKSIPRCAAALAWFVWIAGATAVVAQNPPPAPPAAAEAPPPEDDAPMGNVTMNFQDVELPTLVKFISEITGRNFIVDERVKGKITIISPSQVTVDEAYLVFQSVLQVKGFTTVPSGPVIKIVPSKDAKASTLDTISAGRMTLPSDEFITRIVPLSKVDASGLLPILQPLVSPDGLLTAYGPTNSIIVIDAAANTERLVSLLLQLDVEGVERDIEVIRLQHAFADDVAAKIAEVLQEDEQQAGAAMPIQPQAQPARSSARARRAAQAAAQAGGGGAVLGGTAGRTFKLIPDQRTNSLILLAGPIEMRQIRELVARLDVPVPLGTGRIHVYYLRHANAFELLAVLSSLITGSGNVGLAAQGLGGGARRAGVAGIGGGGRAVTQGGGLGSLGRGQGFGRGIGTGVGGLGGGMGGGFGGGGFGGGGLGGGLTGGIGGIGGMGGMGAGTAIGGTPGATPEAQFEGEVRITADPATNSLVINASPQDYETLKQVIEKLDVRRRQVFIEAIILEVDIDASRSLGFTYQGATGLNNGVGIGRFNFTQDAVAPAATQFGLPGLILAAASSQTIRLPDGSIIPAQAAIINASQGDSSFNLLSAPNLLTTDNQQAEIVAGRNIPFLASRAADTANLANTFATIERRDVGITLRITPQVSEGGTIRLDIFEEVSDITQVAGIDPNALGPATTIRSATTTVVARDGQTVVIGGLIADTIRDANNTIPYLGDIPVIGNLFSNRSFSRSKINLLLFLTPHIVRNDVDHASLSKRQRGKMQVYMNRHNVPNQRQEQMNAPSWDTENLKPVPKEGERGDAAGIRADDDPDTLVIRPYGPLAAEEQFSDLPPAFTLLGVIWERGTPPPSLIPSNGVVPVILPDEEFQGLFNRGMRIQYFTEDYSAVYEILQRFPNRGAAFALYPEGLRLSATSREGLHWRELDDPASKDIQFWSRAN
jgi:general secretion pathway protein D